MGAIGYVITLITGIVAGLLDWLRLDRLSFWVEHQGERFVAWEEGVNRRFDATMTELNPTIDYLSGGLFSAAESFLESIYGFGQMLAYWPDTVSGTVTEVLQISIPSRVEDALETAEDIPGVGSAAEWVTGLVEFVNAILWVIGYVVELIFTIPAIIFIPIGYVVSYVIQGPMMFLGYVAGLGILEVGFIFIGGFLILLNLMDIWRGIVSLPIQIFRPGTFASDRLDDVVGLFVGVLFVMYHISPVATSALMVFGGLGLTFYTASEQNTRPGIYTYTLVIVGIVALSVAVFAFLDAMVLIVGAFATIYLLEGLVSSRLRNTTDTATV